MPVKKITFLHILSFLSFVKKVLTLFMYVLILSATFIRMDGGLQAWVVIYSRVQKTLLDHTVYS